MKRFLIVLVVSCVSAGVFATVALGHTKKFPVTSSFAKSTYFSGTISSPKAACIRNRTVGVYDVSHPENASFATGATSNANGDWRTSGGFFGGTRYKLAIAVKIMRKNADHDHRCKALSKTKEWETAD
jgi:hypothetical protein